jgi:TolB protein
VYDSDFSSIAFIARITDNSADWSLCVMDKSGNNMQKIVDKTTTCQKPIRSNSGTQLLFITYTYTEPYTELYSVNIDGTGLTLIDRVESGKGYFGNPDWSPDDRQIVYVKHSYDSGKSDFIIYNTVDKKHTILNIAGGEDDKHNPKFSPDGKQIMYCATVQSDTLFINSYQNHHIYKVDVDGENNQLIIKEGSAPKWSPKGDKITYLTSGKDGSSQISVANADGSNQKQLTSTVSPGWWDTGFPRDGNSDPQWTTDGKKIVYVSYENGKSEIFIMNSDGSQKTRLTKAEFRDEYPEVTPDGKYILFASRRSTNINMDGGICIMTLDGKSQSVLYKTGICPIACK